MGRVARPHLCPQGFASTSLGYRAGPPGKAALGGRASTHTLPFSVADRPSGVASGRMGSSYSRLIP